MTRGILPLALVIDCLAGNREGALSPGLLGFGFFLKALKNILTDVTRESK